MRAGVCAPNQSGYVVFFSLSSSYTAWRGHGSVSEDVDADAIGTLPIMRENSSVDMDEMGVSPAVQEEAALL